MQNSVQYVQADFQQVSGSKLITTVSYEPRFLESLSRILETHTLSEVVLILFLDYFSEGTNPPTAELDTETILLYRQNYNEAISLLEQAHIAVTEVEFTLDDLPSFALAVRDIDTTDFIVDISTLPRAYLLLLLRFAKRVPPALIYTRGRGRKTEIDAFAVGVKDVVALPGFEGRVGHKPTLLVLSVGYEGARAYKLFRQYEPTATLVLLGDPGESEPERHDILETVRKNNANLLATDAVCHHALPSYDPVAFAETAKGYVDLMVEKIQRTYSSEVDVIVAPIGTKIQALGLFQLWHQRQNYQIAYPIPSVRRLGTAEVGGTIGYVGVTA